MWAGAAGATWGVAGATAAGAAGAAATVAAAEAAGGAAAGSEESLAAAVASGAAAEAVAVVVAAMAAEGIALAAAALALALSASVPLPCIRSIVAPMAPTMTNVPAPSARKMSALLFVPPAPASPAGGPYWSIAGAVSVGAERVPLKAPPLDRFMMSSTRLLFLSSPRPICALSCRMSMRPDASTPGTGGGRSVPLLVSAESEKRTLFSLRAPVGFCSS